MFFKNLKKRIAVGLSAALLLAAAAGCGSEGGGGGAANTFINIGTGGTAGTYYPIGGAMADILNKAIPNMNASAQSTGASVANINMLQSGDIDLAIIQNDIAFYAQNGSEMFEGKAYKGLRAIASLYPETCQIVTLADSGINSIADLKGKRVAVGATGSSVVANARQILEAYGLTYDDIQVQYLSFGEASNALRDGNIDAAFVTAGFPTAALQDISSQNQIRLLAVDADKADAMIAKYPYYTKTVIPANTYAGVTTDTPAVSVMAMLVATDKLDKSLSRDITKALFENLDALQAAHTAAKAISKEHAKDGLSIEMSEGAAEYLSK
ncbi:TAXI family TRAP transporter solute-binding subunit [Selenomonas sp. TAMA-11512]|uniref:TAXI family TRAP transporter solute-binding subunit n=1 Tax=Selenomonas sp. TAMA-11512 TaxID=3095337 RepID=UPI003088FEC5|nr:TAXI family TRAP transporter solute-binding subunit [Selenomonas sp. TAMA-11512]